MAVFEEQGPDGCRFVIRPNCALSWRTTKYLIWFFAACLTAVGGSFLAIGAWLVLPFAGLELAVLVAGFYLSALAGHRCEIIEIVGPVLRVMRGGRRITEVARLPSNWTQVVLRRDPRGWYPSSLLLRCHGRRLQIAAMVVEDEREELAAALEQRLGAGYRWDGDGASGAPRTTATSPEEKLPAVEGASAFCSGGTGNRDRGGSLSSGEEGRVHGKHWQT
jgi:uncharacterized membrane protein